MSNDTGLAVRKNLGKWVLGAVNASSGHFSFIKEFDTRLEAVDAAIQEMRNEDYEYGLMGVEDERPS